MTTSVQAPTINAATQLSAPRVASIDIFRGLTMVVMIFVNDLSSVRGLPWWNYHMAANVDAMTYVDMVYPAFLFTVGMSVPLAVQQRLKRNSSMFGLWTHVLLRAVSLVVLGLIIANAEKGDAVRMGISTNTWGLLALGGAALFWSGYRGSERARTILRILHVCGLLLMVTMFAIFRRTTSDGHSAWIDGSYPEILGLIGYTYLAVLVLYIPTRRRLWAPFAWFLALLALSVFATTHRLHLWPFTTGAMPCICMAGVLTSSIFFGAHKQNVLREKTLLALAFAASTLLAGWLLTSLGISKIRATPTWALYSITASVLLFTLVYWVCDIRKQTTWAAFARPAGANTLLTYLLPDFFYFLVSLFGISYFARHFNYGWPGAVKAALFTAFILCISAALTRWRVRLQL
jgi:heparan-alpha-glucosaminide N-acetyltransferase